MEEVLEHGGRLLTDRESKYHYYKKAFIYSAIVACCITVPFILWEWIRTGHGIFLYYGDYNAQQLAFYRHCVDMVRSGDFGWDWFTDIGSNFVGSYSYYMLGSPFFWLMCLFPSSWAPYLMGPIYILKYITAAMLAYAYLQRWVKNKDYAVLGALLYAFCGFQIYNTFFNQFHEVVALFPLLLIGMEEYVQNNRRGVFAVAVCLNAMVNYFMFAGQVAFCVVYFLFRFSDRSFRVTLKKFGGLFFEAALGAAMSMVLFLPGALGVLGNDRTARSFSKLRDVFFWYKSDELYWQRYGQILESYFFPPDIPSRVNFFHGHTERWASISGYVPMFGMTGVFALFTTKKRGWLKALIIFLAVCSFVPGLNSLFFLGNSSYYARWMYMMVLMFVIGTIIALDRKESRWKGALTLSLGAIAAIAVPLGLLWYDEPSSDAVDIQLGRAPFLGRFWIYVAIAAAGVAVVWYLLKHYRGTKAFSRAMLTATSICIVVYGCVHIENGKEHSHASDFMVDQVLLGEDVVLPSVEEDFYRIDFYRTGSLSTIDNLNIYWHYPSIECFHTVVPPSIMNFYDLLDYNRSVGSRTYSSWYGLRALTSTEYSFIQTNRNNRTVETVSESDQDALAKYENSSDWKLLQTVDGVRTYVKEEFNTDRGWTYYDTQNGFDIYSNDNHLTMGFSFTEFMTESEFKKISGGFQRSILLCTYLVVPDDMADYYSQFMTEVVSEVDEETGLNVGKPKRKNANYTVFQNSVAERREMSCTDFMWDSDGFSAKYSSDETDIVFFSVPAEGGWYSGSDNALMNLMTSTGGWTATVNGKEVEILTVDAGFMAVEVPAGESEIVFTYRTFGLDLGLLISGVALLVFGVYMLWVFFKKKRPDYRFFAETYYDDGGIDSADTQSTSEITENVPDSTNAQCASEPEPEAESEHADDT